MRILFPTLARFPTHEAPSIQVANMAQAFAELGHEVMLVAPAGPLQQALLPEAQRPTMEELFGFRPAFEFVTLSERIHRGQSYLHALRIDRMAASGVDLVFSRNLRACLLPALRGIPTVFEAHTLGPLRTRQDRFVLKRLRRAPGFRGLTSISGALTQDLVTEFSLEAGDVLTAHDAVRLGPEDGRRHAGDPGGRPRVGYTGSLFPGKGADQLPELAMRFPGLDFHVAGGPERAAAALVDRGRALGLENLVVHGPMTPVAARELQRACDMLLAPFARRVESDSGQDIARWTSPMKVFEYMASGRPIVISDLPVLREVLRPDVDALMVPPEDVDALAGAIDRLVADPALGRRLAASALERVRSEFTWRIRASRILERFADGPVPGPGSERE